MGRAPLGRRTTKSARRSDALVGYLIPVFFIVLAGYQQVTNDKIDKYVIGALVVFGLGALGYRIDTLFEKYLEARAAGAFQPVDDKKELPEGDEKDKA